MKLNEEKFHKSRIAFMIINNEILYLEDSKMSHIEWYNSLELPLENFNNIVRGYTKGDKIIYYKGDFEYDEEVIEIAKLTYKQIMDKVNNPELLVYVGVNKGEIGEEWPPSLKIEIEKKKI